MVVEERGILIRRSETLESEGHKGLSGLSVKIPRDCVSRVRANPHFGNNVFGGKLEFLYPYRNLGVQMFLIFIVLCLNFRKNMSKLYNILENNHRI